MTTWVYFLDNTSTALFIDNKPLFSLVVELGIHEDSIFVDDVAGEPVELQKLAVAAQPGDAVLVRSIGDLAGAGGLGGAVETLQHFEERDIEVISVLEPWYHRGYSLEQVARMTEIAVELAERKRRVGMERAKRAGRMGRHPAQDSQGQMERLRQAGFSVKETCDLCGVSRSTFYRRMNQKMGQKRG